MKTTKLCLCSASLVFLPLVGGASELGFNLPPLTYKDTAPLLSSPPNPEIGPDWKSLARQFGAVTQKDARPIQSSSPRYELSIFRPKPGFDYKMRIAEADGAIDPAMIFPKQTPTRRGATAR